MPTAVRSHAKINLGLFLGPPRPDGFHALATVYQTLEMHDLVTVTAKHAGMTTIRISSNDPRVPATENNLAERNTAWKMIALALDALETTADVEIHIDKRLPVQGGLGAGSG
ncbi:MAG: 4-(cytidine 5'-diphospho)-2-C-methyl-D-erythritol kinase, partial [Candidatus Sulfotelmatobacter sp.]